MDGTTGTGSMHLGDSVGLGMTIRIYWSDLPTALQELLGYSVRNTKNTDPNHGTPTLNRFLPWQHPYFPQLVVKNVTDVKGEITQGNSQQGVDLFKFGVNANGFGQGYGVNNGPWSVFKFARITIQFWRPPYYLRTDDDIVAPTGPLAGSQEEWLRYTDKHWTISTELLRREGATFVYAPGQSTVSLQSFVGSVGQKVSHMKLSRTWYQIPEQGIFTPLPDGTPNGVLALAYMKSDTTNPVTGYVQDANALSGGFDANGNPNFPGYQSLMVCGCVNSPIGGGITNYFSDGTDLRFMGCYMGTLLLESIDPKPRELQLPAYLMGIPVFEGNEPISQVQYDVTFSYSLFDPPRPPYIISNTNQLNTAFTLNGANYTINTGPLAQAYRGHNLRPYQDGTWYMPISQLAPVGQSALTTALQYADLSDPFFII